jgi:hypothetical protein
MEIPLQCCDQKCMIFGLGDGLCVICAEANFCTQERGLKVRVKFTLEQAKKAKTGSRDITVLFP